MEKGQVCSSKSQDLLGNSKKKINPVTYSLKTLKTYLASTKGGTSQSCSLKWTKSGMMSSGTFSIQPKSFLNTGNASSLSDILEDDVPEKYFLSSEKTEKLMSQIKQEPKFAVREATKIGYDVAKLGDSINFAQPNSKTRRGRVGHGVANTLTTGMDQATLTGDLKIRKLTPLECWRLQGFPDWAFNRAREAGLSDSQLYKQAGNSVTVPVIKAIADRMKLEADDEGKYWDFFKPIITITYSPFFNEKVN